MVIVIGNKPTRTSSPAGDVKRTRDCDTSCDSTHTQSTHACVHTERALARYCTQNSELRTANSERRAPSAEPVTAESRPALAAFSLARPSSSRSPHPTLPEDCRVATDTDKTERHQTSKNKQRCRLVLYRSI
ncbi:uncharacterized protein LOC143910979 [Arctopsyche grandis]|uniref:uncharacterized protein LOC143910979 n=1 Tax=Arctopsyche grandis TaxID=121162 RepID=UPI00406D64AF